MWCGTFGIQQMLLRKGADRLRVMNNGRTTMEDTQQQIEHKARLHRVQCLKLQQTLSLNYSSIQNESMWLTHCECNTSWGIKITDNFNSIDGRRLLANINRLGWLFSLKWGRQPVNSYRNPRNFYKRYQWIFHERIGARKNMKTLIDLV